MFARVLVIPLTLLLSSIAVGWPGETFTIDPKSPLYHKAEVIEVSSGNTLIVSIDNEITEIRLFSVKIIEGKEDRAQHELEEEMRPLRPENTFAILFEEGENGIRRDENNVPFAYVFEIHKVNGKTHINRMINDGMSVGNFTEFEPDGAHIPIGIGLCREIQYPVQPKGKVFRTWASLKKSR